MSRTVIRDIVIPIVEKIMFHNDYRTSHMYPHIEDEKLEEFLEEEMRKYFGVIGANECQHLKEQLEEARKNDPDAFEFFIKMLIDRYLKLAVKLRRIPVTGQTST